MIYDYIIVGGGSAGSVMANRLSASGSNQVLVCEAGQDTPDGEVPPEIIDSYPGTAYFDPRFHWQELKVHTEIVSHNRPEERPPLRKDEQARVLGGGSSINGQMANRGAPTDYDEWEARGAAGWGWKNVLPFFKKVERDLDFDGPYHGKDGRIPVRRIPREHWTRHSQAFADAFQQAGHQYLADQNGEFVDGFFPVTHSNRAEQRVSAAMGYLDRDTRKRANLTISTNTQVRELLFEGTRCVGVKAVVDGREQEFRARKIILSSGAIHSPAHLLRAGIGPVGHLRDMGIPVLAGLAGVGQRLMDHPSISLSSYVRRGARMNAHTRRHMQMGLRYSSGLPGIPAGDMFVVEGCTFEQVMSGDEALEAFVRRAAIGVWHASCSCRMGRADDPMAVVDTQGRVKGVQGLRVVDASIFPVVPCANTNFPVLMAAEKIAEAIQS